MRKNQKKQAENFVLLLEQIHNEIKRSIDSSDIMLAMELLVRCQQDAIELGNLIENAEGEGFITVGMLEDYCELVYQLHEEIRLDRPVSSNKIYRVLRKGLFQIENSIRNDISVHVEAVFLPYKASMWDSLESVWKAADAEPNCDAYVVPIPYYEKNSDGSVREMHYEGELYPDYVPIVNYENYDFEKRLPDMVFIHYPYDNVNYTTGIPPMYYAKNLRNFTDQLIYIPYFILDEISSIDENAIKSMEHFCTEPAVMYADKVIVQSENMRQIYIDTMTKYTGEETRDYWTKRILGLGSPKLDKVFNTKTSDVVIPDEWKPIIRKPDGSRKKVILYNTSISAFLKNREMMLKKIRRVLYIFEKNRETAVLLWRPHPLMRATIESMQPILLEEYDKIVQEYQTKNFGVYDDTVDMNRAIVISDAYYGDPSSLVQLYQKTGKPIMIQNTEII